MVVFETVEWLAGVVNPTVKDFTTEAEEEVDDGIIALANELNASETFFDRTLEFLGKCLLHFAFVRLIFKYLGMYKDSIIDFYNYTGNTISQIFAQARKCDNLYGTKLSDYNEKISNSALLLNNLSELFDISNDEYFGENVLERIEMFHSHMESRIAMNEIRGLEDTDIENYIINTSAKEDFDGYSDNIYKELGIDNTKIINSEDDNEEFWLNIYDNIYRGKTSEIIDFAINKLIKNSDIAAIASSLADATGLSDVTAGYINFMALSQMEGRIKSKYTELCNSIEKGTHSADDLSKCKELYSAMKEIEIRIQEAYRDMNSDNPEIQIECNEKITELERMEIRKSSA